MPLDYSHEPSRRESPLIVHTQTPYNAETPLSLLSRDFITAVDNHFVRSHGPIPDLDAETHVVEVVGNVSQLLALTVQDMKRKYKQTTAIVALQCAGNRRNQLNEVRPTKGVIWGPGTIGNSEWTGVRLRDILLEAGVPSNPYHHSMHTFHVSFESVEVCEEAPCYGSSIPLEKAMDPLGDVLLAFEMNGAPLTRDHGFPVRVIVPGCIGARSVKYIKRITVQPIESNSYFQQRDYKILPPQINENNINTDIWPLYSAIQETSVQSCICDPQPETLRAGWCTVRGYALSGGGRPVSRVDVSADGGITWTTVTDMIHAQNPTPRDWAWCLWHVRIQCPLNPKLICRAWDSSGNTQPEKPIWNYRGVMNNARFEVVPRM